MNETGDYQGSALYGNQAVNKSRLDATMLNPYAASPDDWETILTSGISSAVVYGINGAINNGLQAGQIQNAAAAQNAGLYGTRRGGANSDLTMMIFAGALLYFFLK